MSLTFRGIAFTMLILLLSEPFCASAGVTVALTAPSNGATVDSPVMLSATANATQGYSVTKVEFFDGSTLVGTDTSSPYGFNWTNATVGSHTLTAKATAAKSGNPNQTATSSAVIANVNASNFPPVVTLTSPSNGATFMAPGNITVTANASDSDGSVANVQFSWFEWTGSDSGSITLTTAPYSFVLPFNPTFEQQTESGDDAFYSLHAVATDNQGATAWTGNITLTVGPSVVISSPAPGATYAEPATIPLNVAISPNYPVGAVEYYHGTTLIAQAQFPYALTWENVTAGSYALTAKVYSQALSIWTSLPVNVTISTAPAPQKLHFIHVDHLNTPRLVADATGAVVWRRDNQEPFGDSPPDENPSGLGAFEFPLGFPGQYFDKETGMWQNWMRNYVASLGRYSESDPIGLKGGLNTYAYVGANPLAAIDPLGLAPTSCRCDNITYKGYDENKGGIGKDIAGKDPGTEDVYGHWWVEIDGSYSAGWWPTGPGSNISGRPGEVNAGLPQDPKHGKPGDWSFNPYTVGDEDCLGNDCASKCKDAANCLRNFAKNYAGKWSIFRSCQNFVKDSMRSCGLYGDDISFMFPGASCKVR